MHILHLDPDDMDNPLSGGGPVRTWEICRRIARKHEVTVLTPTFPGSTPELWREGVRYLRLGRKVGDHGSSHHLTFLAALPGAVRRRPHDLLVEDFMPPASATWTPLFRHRARPFVGSVQWFHARMYTERLKLPFHWGEHLGVRLYPNLVVLTEAMRRLLLQRHPTLHCRVIPNGVDSTLFDLPPSTGDHLLFLGRVEIETKGVDLMLEALAMIPPGRRPRLVIAGTLQQPQALNALLDRTGTRPWVHVHGHFDAAGRARLLQGCRALVMPSRFETFGMVITEAHAAAKPVILWDRAPMNEVCAPSSWRVPPLDRAALAQAMSDAMGASDDEMLARGAVARRHARRFDWDAIAADQLDFYEASAERLAHERRRGRHAV